ncbi:hypothetical protein MMC30_000064 [Trapelia coarctata]|nr:hypothetical protein [Trapelia coarctata]
MSDIENQTNGDAALDESQACYVYVPASSTKALGPRSKKRRKISHATSASEGHQESSFVPLLGGREEPESVAARASTFESAWDEQETLLTRVLNDVNSQTVDDIVKFIDDVDPKENTNRIPTGLVAAGLSANASQSMFAAVADRIKENASHLVISMVASQCSNLKSALKLIIRDATNQGSIDDLDEEAVDACQDVRLLDYDLQSLQEHTQKHSITRMIIYFPNSESIDGNLLADLIDVLSSWQGRIPFVLLFEIATSVELFQEKLPRATIRRLQGTSFETKDAAETLELMFEAFTSPRQSRLLYIGPNVSKMLLDRQMEYTQSAQAFIGSLKYAHMMHLFANALSSLLHNVNMPEPTPLQHEHCEAIRSLPSFRRYVENLLEDGELSDSKKLLDDDTFLQDTAYDLVQQGLRSLHDLHDAIAMTHTIQSSIPSKTKNPWSKLWLMGMSGDLAESPLVREVLLSVRKLPSDSMSNLLSDLSAHTIPDVLDLQNNLNNLLSTTKDHTIPLRSEYDVHHSTVRTTVIAQKVSLSKHKSTLSKEDAAYSHLVDRIDLRLKNYLSKSLIHPKSLPLHEIFLFDIKSPAREVFAPAPRQALERALSAPHDYLDCDCCDGRENGLAGTQPATAILYQLYLESGAVINISDLWSAFYAILGPEDGEGGEGREEQILALFYRGLAELRYLGMVKNSRKKTDHLTKLAWKGL